MSVKSPRRPRLARSSLAVAVLAALAPARAAAEEPKPPAGFTSLPISSPAQQVVAKKGDVYFIVSGGPGTITSDADPETVASHAVPEAAGELTAAWDGPAIRAKSGTDERGLEALIGMTVENVRIVTCQWGVGAKQPDAAARDACKASLSTAAFAPPRSPALPFSQPAGWKRSIADDMLYVATKGKHVIFVGEDEGLVVDPAADLQKMTDELSRVFADEGIVVKELGPIEAAGRTVMRVRGATGPTGNLVQYLVPRKGRTMILAARTEGDVPPELEDVLRGMIATLDAGAVGAAAPGPKPAAAGNAAKPGAGKAAEKDAPWKVGVLVGSLVAGVVVLMVLMRAGAARRARARRAAARSSGPVDEGKK